MTEIISSQKKLLLKKTLTAEKNNNLLPADLISFTLTDEKATYEPVQYIIYKEGNGSTQKRFANLLLRGYCSLYALELKDEEINIIFEPNNTHIFLAKKGDSVTVLKETELMTGNTYNLNKDYVERLKNLFSDCQDINESMVTNTGFYEKALIKIFNLYNHCVKPASQPEIFKTIHGIKINPGIYVGYLTYHEKHSSNASGFCTGFFIEILKPSANERLSLSLGLEYKTLKFGLENTFIDPIGINNYKEKDNQEIYGLPLKATYYLSKSKIAPFINFGVTPSISKEEHIAEGPGNSYVQKGFVVYGSLGPGVLIGKVYAEFLAEKEGIITSHGTYYQLRVGVLF